MSVIANAVSLSEYEAERLTQRIALRLDTIADNYVAVMPLIREAIERDAYSALGYRSPGEYVSDRFGGSLSRLGVEVRREVVKELTAAGLSTRAIAPVVGASFKTVARDLASGVSGDTPNEPDYVQGLELLRRGQVRHQVADGTQGRHAVPPSGRGSVVTVTDDLDAPRQRRLLANLAADCEANAAAFRARFPDAADEQASMAARLRAHLATA